MPQRRERVEAPAEALGPGAVGGGRRRGLAARAREPGEAEVEPPTEEAEAGDVELGGWGRGESVD